MYSASAAQKQTIIDTETFLNTKAECLKQAFSELRKTPVSLACIFDARDLGQSWYEGIDWLEQVFRQAASRIDIACASYSRILSGQAEMQKITPFMSVAEGSGYVENLLDKSNG